MSSVPCLDVRGSPPLALLSCEPSRNVVSVPLTLSTVKADLNIWADDSIALAELAGTFPQRPSHAGEHTFVLDLTGTCSFPQDLQSRGSSTALSLHVRHPSRRRQIVQRLVLAALDENGNLHSTHQCSFLRRISAPVCLLKIQLFHRQGGRRYALDAWPR